MKIDIIQLEFVDLALRQLCVWLEQKIGWEPTITSVYRIGDTGVHGQLPVRGIDLRMRNKEVGKVIEKLVNDNWIYDPKRWKLHCALLHGKESNMHLHLQTCSDTVFR